MKSWEINNFFSRYRAWGVAHCTRVTTYVSTALPDCLEACSWQGPHTPALCLQCLPSTPPWSRTGCPESQLSRAQVERWAACSLCMCSALWQQESKQRWSCHFLPAFLFPDWLSPTSFPYKLFCPVLCCSSQGTKNPHWWLMEGRWLELLEHCWGWGRRPSATPVIGLGDTLGKPRLAMLQRRPASLEPGSEGGFRMPWPPPGHSQHSAPPGSKSGVGFWKRIPKETTWTRANRKPNFE